jgi:VWFA-related protein
VVEPFLFATSQGTERSENQDALRISTDLVVLDVQVLRESDGSPIENLRASDFELFEDRTKQDITHFSLDRIPISVILLLDISGSLRPYLNDLGAGALAALQRLKPEDEVAIMTFGNLTGGYVHLEQGFGRDREETARRLRQIGELTGSGGGTNIPFALNEAARSMPSATYSRSRRVVIVITDNQPAALGRLRKQDGDMLLAGLYESETLVCALTVGGRMSPTEQTAMTRGEGAKVLASVDFKVEPYVAATGGEIIRPGKEAGGKLIELFVRLRTRYAIGYASTNQTFDGKFRRINLRLGREAERVNQKAVIRTRRGYYAKARP